MSKHDVFRVNLPEMQTPNDATHAVNRELERIAEKLNALNEVSDAHYGRYFNVNTEGDSFGWRDMPGSINAAKVTGANQPTWANFGSGSIYGYSFSASTMNEAWIVFHVDHDYRSGTYLWPHFHWSTEGTNAGVVRWGFEYSVAKGHQQQVFGSDVDPPAHGATSTIYIEQAGAGSQYMHHVAEGVNESTQAIQPQFIEPDSLIVARVFRDAANAADTQSDPAFLWFVDMHYKADKPFTLNKSPDFNS